MRKTTTFIGSALLLLMIIFFPFTSLNANAAAGQSPRLSKSSLRLALNKTYDLKIKNYNHKVFWSSSNNDVVSIEKAKTTTVRLRARKVGASIITATLQNGKTVQCSATTYDPIKITGTFTSIQRDKSKYLKATGGNILSCSSSDTNIITIKKISSKKVRITGKHAGTAQITVRAGTKEFHYTITVRAPKRKLRIAIAGYQNSDTYGIIWAVQRLGATACIVHGSCNPKNYDGLILPGSGHDIDPSRYHQSNKGSKGINKALDSLQFTALNKFIKAKKPILGICRGMQMINIKYGGTLKQDVKNHSGKWHATTIQPGSRLYDLYGGSLKVNSYHHQAIGKLGKGIIVAQIAKNGIIEGIEHETLPIYGVQWHPEMAMGKNGDKIFKDFFNLCRQFQ